MTRRVRPVERHDFQVGTATAVVSSMGRLADAGDGWINLVPKTADGEDSPSLGFFTLFGGGGTGVMMCTWIPEGRGRRARRGARLGISHVTGRRAEAQLRSLGITIPEGWSIEQDHPRRGLVLQVPVADPHDRVLAWALRAADALSTRGSIGVWRAEVHLPETALP